MDRLSRQEELYEQFRSIMDVLMKRCQYYERVLDDIDTEIKCLNMKIDNIARLCNVEQEIQTQNKNKKK